MREWDEARGAAKGTAFRRFKQCRAGHDELRDYRRLDHTADHLELQRLKVGNRIYMSTVHAVMISPTMARRMDDCAP